jgi:hypothetical protein
MGHQNEIIRVSNLEEDVNRLAVAVRHLTLSDRFENSG